MTSDADLSDALEAALYFLGVMVAAVSLIAAVKRQLWEGLAALAVVLGATIAFAAIFFSLKDLLVLSDVAALFLTILLFSLAIAYRFGYHK